MTNVFCIPVGQNSSMWLKQLAMASVTTFKPFTEFLHEVWLLPISTHSKVSVEEISPYY